MLGNNSCILQIIKYLMMESTDLSVNNYVLCTGVYLLPKTVSNIL